MFKFNFKNPTKIIFGEGCIKDIAAEIDKDHRILITYGGGSIKSNGVLDQVKAALNGYTLFEFSGIEPNPSYETLMKAVELVRLEKIDYLLAVGGGSVIDGTKFIAAAVDFQGEPWDLLAKQAAVKSSLPFGTVLTLPATGSEMNSGAVVTRRSLQTKLPFSSPLLYPQFSVLDPTTTYSLPARQISNGVVDAFVHTVEQYLTYPVNAKVQDRFAEGLLLTLIEEGPVALQDPQNYDVRANIMWCATLALNGLIGAGVPQDWATHMIGHELTAIYGLDHAQTLAVVLPSVLTVKKEQKAAKLLQYAERVWGIVNGEDGQRIDQAIEKTRLFFERMQVKTRLSDYGIKDDSIDKVVAQLEQHSMVRLGEKKNITPAVSREILKLSL
ncbi:NADP-dependent alcohol dehydrogenase [Desulfuromusa kysingii]|uniref:NADP-dependent alcohol dehydrogenase n=1 Tax=Desulfuromusa kysingii TaxID=37625 RepID=A0A1H4BCS8_9BACT|nr:iron-containing alcohol dehydrogenase [Desulfuromusa kysingii]SEA46005.1 NADP-dependent alcohol dehydrogenase [Desulfuromusa kysingii]